MHAILFSLQCSIMIMIYDRISKLVDSSEELDSETDSKNYLPLGMTSVLL